jgi:ABC-type branched-subunit amino acid transport system substrate-binding protein
MLSLTERVRMRSAVILFLLIGIGCLPLPNNGHAAGVDAQGVSDAKILVGSSCPLTGHVSYLGQGVVTGLNTYFRFINSQGGIFGRKIELITNDDDYNPPLMISNVTKMIEQDKVFALIGLVGTPTTLTVVGISQERKIPLLFSITGAIELRRPLKRYIMNLRPSYWDECATAVDYFIKKGKKRFAVFYQNDAYGLNGRNGVDRRLIKYDLNLITEASYIRGVPDVKDQVQEINKYNPDVVIMIGTADACSAFVKDAISIGMKDVWFSNVSFVGSHELAKKLQDTRATVFVTEVLPSPFDTSLPAVREYQQLLGAYYPEVEPNPLSLEGFLSAKLFVEAMKRKGNNPDRESLIEILEEMHDVDIGIGENVNFSSTDHQGLDRVYITKIENGKIIYLQD